MFLDIAIGIFAGIAAAVIGGDMAQLPWFVLGGIAFALLPDVDFVVHRAVWRRGAHFDYMHRYLLHKPLPYVLIGTALVWWISGGSMVWCALFALTSLWHFAHDTVGVGFGVQWLWPFSSDLIGYRHHGLAQCAQLSPTPRWCRVPRAQVDAYVRAQTPPRESWIAHAYAKSGSTIARVEYGYISLAIIFLIGVIIFFYE